MQSPVNWALLGLVIERASYAYELAQRFERTYEGALTLSSVSQVYTAIGALEGRGLIEEIAGTRSGRQPKPIYRVTATGLEQYRGWLVTQAQESARRRRLFVLQLGALTRDPQAALTVVERFEEACLEEAGATPITGRGAGDGGDGADEDSSTEGNSGLIARLLAEESRLAVGAKLEWVQYARRELKAMVPR